MCRDCGCSTAPDHSHSHPHAETHEHSYGRHTHTLAVNEALLGKNDELAQRNRTDFKAKGLLVLNVLSAPGSGKTAFLERTLVYLKNRLRAGVIVGDLETDNDAQRLARSQVPPGNSIEPGAMQLTRIPLRAREAAWVSVYCNTAALMAA